MTAAEIGPTLGALRKIVRFVLLALLAVGAAAAWRWRAELDPSEITAAIARFPAAPLVFIGLHIAASLCFVPRTLLALVAGLLFGMWWGILWALIGSVLGAAAGFLAARYLNAGIIEPEGWSRLGPALTRVERGGWRIVAVIRLIPILPHSLSNYALGLTRLRFASYLIGSLVGQLPLTIAYADIGAAGGRALNAGAHWPAEVVWPSAIGFAALALSLLIPAIVRWRSRRAALSRAA